MSITVTKKLKAHVEGAGSIVYEGSPAEVEKKVDGLGSIEGR